MPMHDWTRVEDGIYHHFHGRWLYAITDALNGGILPPTFYALTDQVVEPFEPDVIALHARRPADPLPPVVGATALAAHPPEVQTVETARLRRRRRKHRQVAVRHVSKHRIVAVVELVSPGNKSSVREFNRLVNKAADLLDAGIHLLVIDPYPPTARHPGGIHGAVWKAVARRKYSLPADRPLTAASYIGGGEVTAFVQPFAVGQPVPAMPLFIDPDEYVTLPLEETYRAAWPTVPLPYREVLER
ncbi:MAG: DUF4058 family protein [Gemmataceae bacterium]